MKTYTFKIKVDSDKVVIAVNMQLEQFFDSVKLTDLKELCERYPYAYITACDYYDGNHFITDDHCLSSLRSLLDSKDLKSYLTSEEFFGFVGDYSYVECAGAEFVSKAHSSLLDMQSCKDEDIKDDEEVIEDELSETNKK